MQVEIINVILRSEDMARFGPGLQARFRRERNLPPLVLRARALPRGVPYRVTCRGSLFDAVCRMVEEVLDEPGHTERLAAVAWSSVHPDRSWEGVPESVKAGMRKMVRVIREEVLV